VTDRLFAVAALPPAQLAGRVDAVRRALDDPRRHDLPAHLTLVAPIPLGTDGEAAARGTLRSVAATHRPLELRLGPAASFTPTTPTLHLSVEGQLDELSALVADLRAGAPFVRPEVHGFVPHVTLLQQASAASIEAGLGLLSGELGSWELDRIHLLERLRPEGGPIWHPVAEEPLGGPHVVGRGGVELHLRSVGTLEPAAATLLGTWLGPDEPLPAGGDVLVAVAELAPPQGGVVGVAVGRVAGEVATLERLHVSAPHRGVGVARQVVAQWAWSAAARRGASTALAPVGGDDGVLGALGFERAGRWWVRADLG
jgi:2'-5' RNA ligase